MKRGQIIFPLTIAGFVSLLLAAAAMQPSGSWRNLGFPLGVALPLLLACLLQASRSRHSETNGQDTTAVPSSSTMAWLLAAPASIAALGFLAGPALFLICYLRWHAMRWSATLGSAVGIALLHWGLVQGLRVPLPLGPPWLA